MSDVVSQAADEVMKVFELVGQRKVLKTFDELDRISPGEELDTRLELVSWTIPDMCNVLIKFKVSLGQILMWSSHLYHVLCLQRLLNNQRQYLTDKVIKALLVIVQLMVAATIHLPRTSGALMWAIAELELLMVEAVADTTNPVTADHLPAIFQQIQTCAEGAYAFAACATTEGVSSLP